MIWHMYILYNSINLLQNKKLLLLTIYHILSIRYSYLHCSIIANINLLAWFMTYFEPNIQNIGEVITVSTKEIPMLHWSNATKNTMCIPMLPNRCDFCLNTSTTTSTEAFWIFHAKINIVANFSICTPAGLELQEFSLARNKLIRNISYFIYIELPSLLSQAITTQARAAPLLLGLLLLLRY